MTEYVIVQFESGDEGSSSKEKAQSVELPAEENGTLLLTVLQSQYEGATGLKYRNPTTGSWRGVRINDGVLHPPSDGWGNSTYVVVVPKKADMPGKRGREKGSEEEEEGESARTLAGHKRHFDSDPAGYEQASKSPRTSTYQSYESSGGSIHSEDLIVLGLEYSVTEKDLIDYFQTFGEVVHVEVKRDHNTNKSRGFGFIRFKDPNVQNKVYSMSHTLKSRRCELKRPRKSPGYLPCKFFVGCLPTNPEATSEELRQHFMQYGLLSDVYIPRPYRGFGFVTYMDGYDGQKMMAQQHTIRGSRLNITVAEPKGSHITSHKPGGGYGYAGVGSYAVDAQPVASSAGYVGYNPQYYGYGSASEYSRAQYISPGYQSQPSVAHSSQQQPQTHQQHQYYSNGQLPPPPPPPQQY